MSSALLDGQDAILEDEEDYGVRWWDDLELKGKVASDKKATEDLIERLAKLYEYCRDDVRSEREAEIHLYHLSDKEQQVYFLDQKINDRGIAVDVETIDKSLELIGISNIDINKKIFKLTNGVVDAVTKRDKLVGWLRDSGFEIKSLDKQNLALALARKDLSDPVRMALELRQFGAKTSVRKLIAMKNMVDEDGRIRGNILYHGASTGRFAGKGVQFQNLPRPELSDPAAAIPYIRRGAFNEIELCFGPVQNVISDCIRSLLVAGPGKVFYAADFAAIEARVLAWIAGQWDLIEQFTNGDDVYLNFAGEIYGRKLNKKEHGAERQLGKACIAEGTLVYTNQGLIPIEKITEDMQVWDGKNWVTHSGLVYQGTKQTLNLCGVSLTPDHLVLCGEEWLPSQSLVQDDASLCRALDYAAENSPLLDTSQESEAGFLPFLFAASVVQKTNTVWTKTILENLQARAVIFARLNKAKTQENDIGATETFAPMMSTVKDCSTEFLQLYSGAEIQNAKLITRTGEEESTFIKSGSKIAGSFFLIYSPSPIGIFRNLNWIEETTTLGMNPAIYDSYLEKKMSTIEEVSGNYKHESKNWKRVYDITNAGPNNRFTIYTECGPLIVHNCILGLGFMMGAMKFKLTCEKSGIFLDDDEYERIVKLYRRKYNRIYRLWYGLEKAAITAVKNPNVLYTYKCFQLRMRGDNLRLKLPSGRVLNYPFATVVKNATPWGEVKEAVEINAVNALTRRWERTIVSPGTFTENVVQAIARDLMVESMFRLEENQYPIVLTIHDELLSEVDSGYGSVAEYEALVAATPEWAKGLPVKAEGWSDVRYRK